MRNRIFSDLPAVLRGEGGGSGSRRPVSSIQCLRRSAVDKDCRVPERIFPRDVGRCLVNEFLIGNGHPWRESCYLFFIDFEQIRWRGWPAATRIFVILIFGIPKLFKKNVFLNMKTKKNPPAAGC